MPSLLKWFSLVCMIVLLSACGGGSDSIESNSNETPVDETPVLPTDETPVDETPVLPTDEMPVTPPNTQNNEALPRDSWGVAASSNMANIANAIDGSSETRWTTQVFQEASQFFDLDLAAPTSFNRIVLDTENSPKDFPRGYEVFISDDGIDWGQAVKSGIGQESTIIDLDSTTSRYLRITQTGESNVNWWSIHEINLFLIGNAEPTPIPDPEPIPSTLNGAQLYEDNCSNCHKPLAETTKSDKTSQEIQDAIDLYPQMQGLAGVLTVEMIDAIANALSTATNPDQSTLPTSEDFFPDSSNYSAINRRAFRLTKPQIINTINQILNTNISTDALGLDPREGSFSNSSDFLVISNELLEDIMSLVEDNYSPTTTTELKTTLMSCSANASLACTEDNCTSCVNDFISRASSIAYRKPITTDQRNELKALYADLDSQYNRVDVMSYFLQTILTNPNFLFRFEEGVLEDNQYNLSAHEKLAQTSLTLTNKPPSQDDVSNADSIVNNKNNFRNYVNTLLASDDGHAVIETFLKQWVGIDVNSIPEKDASPIFTDNVKSAMIDEIDQFIANTVDQPKVTLETLLTSDYSSKEPALVDFYAEDEDGVRFDNRKGILLKAGYAAINSSSSKTNPTQRGSKIVDQLLCYELPPFPEEVNIITENPDINTPLTTRQKFEAHSTSPECSSCHEVMDPLGFGLENYDVYGSFRSTENDIAVDASDEFSVLPYTVLNFSGPIEMVEQLAATPELKACLVRQAFRFTNGRLERPKDNIILSKAMDSYEASDFDIRVLFESLLTNSENDIRD